MSCSILPIKIIHQYLVTAKLFTVLSKPIGLVYFHIIQYYKCGADERISASLVNASFAKFVSDLEEEIKFVLIWWQAQNVLFYILERETFVQNVRLRYFTMWCNGRESVVNRALDGSTYPG
jgi:hypothetical protein